MCGEGCLISCPRIPRARAFLSRSRLQLNSLKLVAATLQGSYGSLLTQQRKQIELNNEIASLQSQIGALAEDVMVTKKAHAMAAHAVQEGSAVLNRKQTELQGLQACKEQLSSSASEYNASAARLVAELQLVQRRCEETESECSTSAAEAARLQSAIEELGVARGEVDAEALRQQGRAAAAVLAVCELRERTKAAWRELLSAREAAALTAEEAAAVDAETSSLQATALRCSEAIAEAHEDATLQSAALETARKGLEAQRECTVALEASLREALSAAARAREASAERDAELRGLATGADAARAELIALQHAAQSAAMEAAAAQQQQPRKSASPMRAQLGAGKRGKRERSPLEAQRPATPPPAAHGPASKGDKQPSYNSLPSALLALRPQRFSHPALQLGRRLTAAAAESVPPSRIAHVVTARKALQFASPGEDDVFAEGA